MKQISSTKSEVKEFLLFHTAMSRAKDIDPANDCLLYICDRFELNEEQRYWLAFLYSTCYCAPTAFFMYNEFPDYENVDIGRLSRWWDANRPHLIFQTDRAWIRSKNQFVDVFRSYKGWLNGLTQGVKFYEMKAPDPCVTYFFAFAEAGKIFTFGRFTLFLYLEMVNVLTGLPMTPYGLDLQNAESSRNGLCFVYGFDEWMTHFEKKKLSKHALVVLQEKFRLLMALVKSSDAERDNVWNVETTLCAYKKFKLGKRYVGYYIERMRKEIALLQSRITTGVDWEVLWDFRRETYDPIWLKEA